MFNFGKADPEYLAYAHEINLRNLRMFSWAAMAVCLLLLTDRSGPTLGVRYNHIFNSDVIGSFFALFYFVIAIVLNFIAKEKLIQKIAIWAAIAGAYILAGSISYISVFSSDGLTAVAVAYLMVSFLFAERLVLQILLLLANAIFFYITVAYLGEVDPTGFRVGMMAIVFLSILVFIATDKQRKEVFYSRQKVDQKVKELNNALDVKASFFGHMSHELRTPLNAIIGFSDLLKMMAGKGMDPKKVEKYAGFINTGGNHLLSLVNDLLDQNKLETGKFEVSIETLNVGELLKGYIDELAPISDNKNQSVKFNKCSEQVLIQSDRRIFKQIIYNLLSNAIKYTPEEGMIEISLRKDQDGFVKIEIIDNGRGMPEDVVEQVRNNSAPMKSHFISHAEGTGLGLIIVRQLLYRLGATIDVTSKINAGTCVTLTFPTIYSQES